MAGTSKSYNADKIVLGPSDVWLGVAVPGAGAQMAVALNAAGELSPDATANPSCVHLGMTEGGITFSYKPNIQDLQSDELTAPHLSRIISEDAVIKGNFLQVYDWSILEKMTVGGTKTASTSTVNGYNKLTFGGLSNITTFSVAVIGPDVAAPTKYWVIQLYKSFNRAGFEFGVTRKNQSSAPFEFKGMAVTTRAAGDQIGAYWSSIVAAV